MSDGTERTDLKASNWSRRQILRALGGMAIWPALPTWAGHSAGRTGVANAFQALDLPKGRKPTLVLVFLRGGLDGLNFIVPHSEEEYYRLRPGLAIPRPGEPNGALLLDDTFGFHPACAPLMPLMQKGVLAGMHAVGHPENTRSHFEEQERWELAAQSDTPGAPGWLGRYLSVSKPRGPIRAIALGDRVPRSLRGPVSALALRSLSSLVQAGSGGVFDATLRALRDSHGGAVGADQESGGGPIENALAQSGRDTLEAMQRLGAIAQAPDELKGEYPKDALGLRFSEVARLIRSDLGVEVIQVDHGGFDTHRNQAQPFQNLIGSLSRSVTALHTDLEERLDDVLVLTVSEFGRTVRVNGTRGTDHGSGSCLLAMGGAVKTNQSEPRGILGDWPTLTKEALLEQRDLRPTTDIRNIYAEVLQKFLGVADSGKVLPGWKPTPLGLLV